MAMSDEALVEALCGIDHGLTDWEVEFVESVAKRVLDDGRGLSEKQRKRAEAIYLEKG